MIPWVQVYSNLLTHPKTARLAEGLKLTCPSVEPEALAVGMLVGLWTWAVQNAYDGDLSNCTSRSIATACRWKKSPDALVAALKQSGWLDDDMTLHNWDQYAVLLIDKEDERKAKAKDRVQRYRDKKTLPAATPL